MAYLKKHFGLSSKLQLLFPAIIKLLFLFSASTLFACSSFFFYPTRDVVNTPDQIGVKYKAMHIDDGNGPILYGWFLPAEGKALGTILHMHGNAENISTHFRSIFWLPAKHFNVFTFDYRGYGASEGSPSLEGVHADAMRATRFINEKVSEATKPLFLLGQSLGASIAIYTAAQAESRGVFKAVVAESPFATYRGIVREKLNSIWLTKLFKYPMSWTVPSTFDALKVIAAISPTPLLIIHPKQDQIVSFENSNVLFEKANLPKELVLPESGGHIQYFENSSNREKLVQFLLSK